MTALTAADVTVLERVVRRAGLAVRLTDLATGRPVADGITVTAWPAGAPPQPELAAVTRTVSALGVAGFHQLPGLRTYEDGSTARDDWFASPVVNAPRPFAVRVDDTTGTHLRVVREVLAPSATPIDIALPRSPAALAPSGWLTATATVVTESADPAAWAVVELTVNGGGGSTYVTGGVADERGVVSIPVPRSLPPVDPGTPTTEPSWLVAVGVRYRPADQHQAPGATIHDPPTMTSLLTQQLALVSDGGVFGAGLARTVTTGGPLVITSSTLPASPANPWVLVVRPTP
jgi:hypothetical protein